MAAEAERADESAAELLSQPGGAGLINSNRSMVSSLSELIKWSVTSQPTQGLNSAPLTAQPTTDSEVTVMTSEKQHGSVSRKKPGRKPRKTTSVRNTMQTESGNINCMLTKSTS